jgi:hypothetical protein
LPRERAAIKKVHPIGLKIKLSRWRRMKQAFGKDDDITA